MNKDTSYYLRMIIKIVILMLILLGIFGAFKLAIFYMPFIIAMLIAKVVEPVIKFIMKYTKIKRKLASVISLILVIGLITGILFFLGNKIVSESVNLISNLNTSFEEIGDWAINIFNDIQNKRDNIPVQYSEAIQNSLSSIVTTLKDISINVVTWIVGFATSIPTMITYAIITILAIIFICFDKEYLPNLIKSQIPTKWFNKIKEVIKEMFSVSFKYIKAESKLSFICFILVLIGLVLFDIFGLNVGSPITMAVVIGIIDLLPLFGAGAVMLPWALYLLITGNIPLGIAVIILWVAWAIIKQLAEPKMVSKEMGMHPIFTLIGMYTGFKLFGVFGLILGPIALLIIKNIFSELINKGVLKSFFEME